MLLLNTKKYFTGLKDGKMDGWVDGKNRVRQKKTCKQKIKKLINGPHLSCDLHKIGAIGSCSFLCKKVWSWMDGWMDGWVDGWMVEPG